MYFQYKTFGVARLEEDIKKFNFFKTHPNIVNKELAKSYYAKLYFFWTHLHYCLVTGDSNGAYYYAKEQVDFIEAHPHHIEENPNTYCVVIHNFLLLTMELKKYKEFFRMISKLKMISVNENIRPLARLSAFNLELSFYIEVGNFKKATELLPEIEAFIKEKPIDNLFNIGNVICNSVMLYFSKGEYNKALNKINIILNDYKTYIRQDFLSILRLMQIAIHFEKKDNSLLPYLIKSYYRFLMNKKMLYKTESIFNHFMRTKIKSINTLKEQTEALKYLKNEIEEAMKDPLEAQLIETFDIIAWLESKITNRSFEEIVREKSGFWV